MDEIEVSELKLLSIIAVVDVLCTNESSICDVTNCS